LTAVAAGRWQCLPSGGAIPKLGHSGYLKGAASVVKSSGADVERFDVTS